MFRAGLTLIRRLISAALLLVLLVCGAEVGVRIYEVISGDTICGATDVTRTDPSGLSAPSRSYYQDLKPLATAKVNCRDTERDIEIRTNSLGLRGTEPTIPKPNNVCRIVVLGDDTIFAPEVPDSEHFCTLLQNQLQQQTRMRVEVINAGIPGHCPMSEYLLFKKQLLSLRPDLVLMHFDWSDVYDDRQMRRMARCDDAGKPLSCPHPTLGAAKKFQKCEMWRQHFRLLDWGMSKLSQNWKQQLARQKAASREADTNPYSWLRDERVDENIAFELARRPIVDLAQLCYAENCSFVLMTSPKPWQVSAKCSKGPGVRLAAGVAREACYSSRAPFNVLAAFSDQAKIPYVDVSAAFRTGREAEATFLRHAPRWSPETHRQISEMVASFLSSNVSGAWNSPYFQQNDPPITSQNSDDRSILWMKGEKTLRGDSRQ